MMYRCPFSSCHSVNVIHFDKHNLKCLDCGSIFSENSARVGNVENNPSQERDWQDVCELKALIDRAVPSKEIWTRITTMSHEKYPFMRGSKSHLLRRKYREWLKKQIKWPYNGLVLHKKAGKS